MNKRLLLRTAAAVVVADQLSKLLVVHVLDLKTVGSIAVLPPYLNFHMAWNRGVNFGLLASANASSRWVLVAVAVAISVWVIHWMRDGRAGTAPLISAGLLVGGAAGNVIDRLIYGAVADFLNMSCCGIDNPFAFNLADIAIFAGALGLILFTDRKKAA